MAALVFATGCEALGNPDATPVPGAAATAARAARTAIPTRPAPASAAAASPEASPSPAASPGATTSPSPRADSGVTDQQIQALQQQFEQALAAADLPGVERLLLDRVALATPQGGQELDREAAASWLRDRAGPGIRVVRVDRSALAVLLQVTTDGWPRKDPIQAGRVVFNLHRYDAAGRLDETRGDWKIDVISAE